MSVLSRLRALVIRTEGDGQHDPSAGADVVGET